MADLAGMASFPGVKQIENYQGTLAHGASPSVHQLDIAPQFGFPKMVGDLVLTFGKNKITLKDCKIDTASYQRSREGAIVSVVLLDRRWKWRYPVVSGSYNVRDRRGAILKDEPGGNEPEANNEYTPQELAKFLLKVMGETGYDIADLPNKARPTVHWDNTNAAKALADLCETLGCRLVLEVNGKVAIRKNGFGKGGAPSPMPGGPETPDSSDAIELKDRPDSIKIVTAPILYQQDFLLEAVGRDVAGLIVPIDDLSYKPAEGWNEVDLAVDAGVEDDYRALAQECVYRWYRVKTPFKSPFVPGKVFTNLKQFVPFLDKQVAADGGSIEPMDAQVFGCYYDEFSIELTNRAETLTPAAQSVVGATFLRDWTLDPELGIVKFSRPIYFNAAAASGVISAIPAKLVLRTSFHIMNLGTRALARYERERKLGGPKLGTGALTRVQDDIQPTIYATYKQGGYFTGGDARLFQVDKLIDNINADVKPAADHYLDAIEKEFQNNDPQQKTFAGLHPFNPDGALQSISWYIQGGGAYTKVSRNRDYGTETTAPFAERRRLERQQRMEEFIKAAQVEEARNRGREKRT